MSIPQDKWKWFGSPGHFCSASDCNFHILTEIGEFMVSTVGEWVPAHYRYDPAWLKENPFGDDVSPGRKYETMVFHIGSFCQGDACGDCGRPILIGDELDSCRYKTAGTATKGHMELCHKWAEKGD